MCRQCQDFHQCRKRFPQVKIGQVERHLASLDLGKIEDVVDDLQKGIRGLFDQRKVFALLRRKRSVHHQFRHADDAVHRCADLMAHVSQELTLRLIGCLKCFVGLAQGRLGALALDVLPELTTDGRHHLERFVVGLFDFAAGEFENAEGFPVENDREAKASAQADAFRKGARGES